jgi:hypothetical protein
LTAKLQVQLAVLRPGDRPGGKDVGLSGISCSQPTNVRLGLADLGPQLALLHPAALGALVDEYAVALLVGHGRGLFWPDSGP